MEEISDSNTMARLNYTGHIWFVRELTSKFKCNMDLQMYPLDIQVSPGNWLHSDIFFFLQNLGVGLFDPFTGTFQGQIKGFLEVMDCQKIDLERSL